MSDEAKEYYSLPARCLYTIGIYWQRSLPGKLTHVFRKGIWAFLTLDQRHFRTEFRQILNQIYFTGIEAIPVISMVSILLGTLTITQALTVMPKVGFGDFFGTLMVIVIVRELGPVLTAFLIAGRTGAALAAYVGNMKVESEIDALETMGIDPNRFIIMPALIGAMIASLILSILFSTLAIVMGFITAKSLISILMTSSAHQLLWGHYLHSILIALNPLDFLMMVVKPIIFGAIIACNAIHYGMSIQKDARDVPKATSRSVVYSLMFVVAFDLVLTLIYIFEYMQNLSTVL